MLGRQFLVTRRRHALVMDNSPDRLYPYPPSGGKMVPVQTEKLYSEFFAMAKATDVEKSGLPSNNLQAGAHLRSTAGHHVPCPEISDASSVCDKEALSYAFFIQSLPYMEVHPQVVKIRERDDQAEMLKSIFSTQSDPSLCVYSNRRARGGGTVVRDEREVSLDARRSHDRDPGPGLLAFSRSPVSGPLFYKRNFNPQNGGYA